MKLRIKKNRDGKAANGFVESHYRVFMIAAFKTSVSTSCIQRDMFVCIRVYFSLKQLREKCCVHTADS